MSGELGKASYELGADLTDLRKNFAEAHGTVDNFEGALDRLTEISRLTEEALKQIRMTAGQGSETSGVAESIIAGVHGISDEARTAARELDNVKLTEAQATESEVAGERIKRNINDIGDEADRTKRKLEEVQLAGRNGAGVGPFGSGFGRIGLLGGAIGAGALTVPAAGPGAVGLLAAIGPEAGAIAGSLGVLALAFDGVTKAIGGNKKAFDDLGPSAKEFVTTVRSLDGWFDQLRQDAAGSLFPGLTAGLKDALSPGTVNAISTAVTTLGRALGMAGEQWGKYFGSSEFQRIFGPLMQDAGRTIGTIADAALHLFDALGVLARAAIPFTDWLNHAIDGGARLVDSWLHARDASGALSGALNEAETSLRLVGGLVVSLLRAVGSLGDALYPVAKIAVKDLTDGLNVLAGLISRNKDVIREIVSTALNGLVTAVKLAADGIELLDRMLGHIVGDKATVITAIVAIGAVLAATLGPEAAAVLGVALAIGYIERHWDELVDYIKIGADKLTLGILEPFSHLPGALGKWARDAKIQVEDELASSRADLQAIGEANGNAYGKSFADAVTATMAKSAAGMGPYKPGTYGSQPSTPSNPGGYTLVPDKIPNASYTQKQVYQLLIANGVPRDVATNLSIISAHGEDPSGSPYALNDNPKTGDYSVGLFQENFLGQMGVDRVKKFAPQFGLSPTTSVAAFVSWLGKHPAAQAQIAYQIFQDQGYGAWTTAAGLGITGGGTAGTTDPFGALPPWSAGLGSSAKPSVIPSIVTDLMNRASQNANKAKQLGNAGGTARGFLNHELDDLEAAQRDLAAKIATSSGKTKTELETKATEVANKIRDVQTLIKNSILIIGDALLPPPLRTKLAMLTGQFTADSAYASVLVGQAAENMQKLLLGNVEGQAKVINAEEASLKAKLDTATGKQKAAIKIELDKVTTQLQSVQQQVIQSLQANVQTMQQHVATAFGKVQTQLLAQLGGLYFQNGAKTPLEQKLADMQTADTANSLQDALDQAKQQLATDIAAAADQATIDADNKSIAQAGRAIAENNLAIQAAAERAKADAAYATKSQQLTDRLSKLSDAFQNGTGTIADLNSIASDFGLTIDGQSVPALDDLTAALGDGNSGLIGALHDLADYIEKITGHSPDTPGGSSTTTAASTSPLRIIPVGSAIPMADGSNGPIKVTKPTLFLVGEAGHEEAAFSGAGRTLQERLANTRIGHDSPPVEVPVYLDGRQIALAAKPHIDNVNTIGH